MNYTFQISNKQHGWREYQEETEDTSFQRRPKKFFIQENIEKKIAEEASYEEFLFLARMNFVSFFYALVKKISPSGNKQRKFSKIISLTIAMNERENIFHTPFTLKYLVPLRAFYTASLFPGTCPAISILKNNTKSFSFIAEENFEKYQSHIISCTCSDTSEAGKHTKLNEVLRAANISFSYFSQKYPHLSYCFNAFAVLTKHSERIQENNTLINEETDRQETLYLHDDVQEAIPPHPEEQGSFACPSALFCIQQELEEIRLPQETMDTPFQDASGMLPTWPERINPTEQRFHKITHTQSPTTNTFPVLRRDLSGGLPVLAALRSCPPNLSSGLSKTNVEEMILEKHDCPESEQFFLPQFLLED